MTEDKTKNNITQEQEKEATNADQKAPVQKKNKFGPRKRFEKNRRRKRPERKQEFEQKLADIRRVVRVMGGGRRFSFSVTMIIGDKKGRVGVGLGKSNDTTLAIEKAVRNAKKNMITVNLTDDMSIPHDVKAKYGASIIEVRPAPGRGLVAGASVRSVLELAGIKDVTAKIWSRSKNKINNSRATIEALKQLDAEMAKSTTTKTPKKNSANDKEDK